MHTHDAYASHKVLQEPTRKVTAVALGTSRHPDRLTVMHRFYAMLQIAATALQGLLTANDTSTEWNCSGAGW